MQFEGGYGTCWCCFDNDDNDDDGGGKVVVMIADIVFGGAMLRDWYIYEYFILFAIMSAS